MRGAAAASHGAAAPVEDGEHDRLGVGDARERLLGATDRDLRAHVARLLPRVRVADHDLELAPDRDPERPEREGAAREALGALEVLELLEERHRAELVRREPGGAREEEDLEEVRGLAREGDDVALAGGGSLVAAGAADHVESREEIARLRGEPAPRGRDEGALEEPREERDARRLVEPRVAILPPAPEELGHGRLVNRRVLAEVERDEVEAEDLGAPPRVPEAAARQAVELGEGEGLLQEPEVVEVVRGAGVGDGAAVARRLEARVDVAELLAEGLDRVDPGRARGDLGEAGAVLLERARELGRDGGAPRRDRELASELRHIVQRAPERGAPVALERRPRHLRRDVGVAVPVAADPRAPPEEGAHLEALGGVLARERVLELAVEKRRLLEESPLEDVDPREHLVLGRGPRGAGVLRGVEREDGLAEGIDGEVALARSRARVVEPLEPRRDRREVVEDGAPPRLGRVGREDRHDEEPPEELADRVRLRPRVVELAHGARDGPFRGLSRAVARPQDADPLLLLGGVYEVKVPREGPGHPLEAVQVEGLEALREGLPAPLEGPRPEGYGVLPQALDGLEDRVSSLLPERHAEEVAEEPHVRAELGRHVVDPC